MNDRFSPDFADIVAASERLAGHAVRTPLLHFPDLDERVGATVFIKPETLQITGSFKFRGAYNRLAKLDDAARPRGVVAWSSGNHAQGVAAAANRLGMAATIVMPFDAPAIKIANTETLGATIRFYDRRTESREEIARALVRETGATLVPSYDDIDVIAGQGTVGLEISQQMAADYGRAPDIALVPCGGGGLVAGSVTALREYHPNIAMFAVEPEAFDDTARSLRSGHPETNPPDATSICDALMAPTPGAITFPINARLLAGAATVTDAMVLAAMAYAWRVMKLVVEPGGAVALAALLHGRIDVRDATVAVALSGGNVDAAMFTRAIGG